MSNSSINFLCIQQAGSRCIVCIYFTALTMSNAVAGVDTKVTGHISLGSYAQNYAIAEPPLDDVLTLKLQQAQSGEAGVKATRDWTDAMRTFYTNPPVTPGIQANDSKHKVRYVDPSISVPEDVFGPDGRLAFAKGSKFNALHYVALPEPHLFFDARDARQVQAAKAAVLYFQGGVRLIAVGGSAVLTAPKVGQRVYYDYAGTFSKNFQIKRVPALITQEKMRYRVDELPLLVQKKRDQ